MYIYFINYETYYDDYYMKSYGKIFNSKTLITSDDDLNYFKWTVKDGAEDLTVKVTGVRFLYKIKEGGDEI